LGFFASPRHAVIADSFRWQWSGATIQKSSGVESGNTWQPILGKKRVHVTGSIVWSNKKGFDLVQSRLEPRPFVCSSQLLPQIGNARYGIGERAYVRL
jgi:hypothetical protein